jgi:hypothetical protein
MNLCLCEISWIEAALPGIETEQAELGIIVWANREYSLIDMKYFLCIDAKSEKLLTSEGYVGLRLGSERMNQKPELDLSRSASSLSPSHSQSLTRSFSNTVVCSWTDLQ